MSYEGITFTILFCPYNFIKFVACPSPIGQDYLQVFSRIGALQDNITQPSKWRQLYIDGLINSYIYI